MLLRQLFEALNQAQKKYVDDVMQKSEWVFDETRYDDIFGAGNTRIYLPMPENAQPNATVLQTLQQLGYKITNYRAGYAISTEQKQYDIRRVLGKSPELLAAWENDPGRTDNSQVVDNNVLNSLDKMGYDIINYTNGILTRENKEEAIGTILSRNKVDPSIINLFANDTYRTSATKDEPNSEEGADELNTSNQIIVITRDKYESAEVSTNKRWTSCLNLGGGWDGVDTLRQNRGPNAHYLVQDVAIGCIAAYLIDKNDTELDDPIARLSIKPFISESNPDAVALGVHDSVYHRTGRPYPEIFKTIVHKWANDINASKELEGMFKLHPDAYNYREFNDENLKQYHGNYKKDNDTFKEYGSHIDQVPDELRTIGYMKMVVQKNPESYRVVYPYCKSINEAADIAQIYIQRGSPGAIVKFPPEFINQDIDLYFDLVAKCANRDSRIVDLLFRHEPELLKRLYTTDSKKFLSVCQSVVKQASEYDFPLHELSSSITDIQMLSDLAKLRNLPSTVISNLVDGLLGSREEIDTDVLISLVSNTRIKPYDIKSIVEYASANENKELMMALDNRGDIIAKSIIESINEVSSNSDLQKIVAELEELSELDISLPHSVYNSVLSNTHINNGLLQKMLINVVDATFVADYISKHTSLSPQLLSELSIQFYDDQTILFNIEKSWFRMVETINTKTEAWHFTSHCKNAKAVAKFIDNPIIHSDSDITTNIIDNIKHNEYEDSNNVVELAIKILPMIRTHNMSQFFSIDEKMRQYDDDKNYEKFQSVFEKELLKRIDDGNIHLPSIIHEIDFNNNKLFNTVLERASDIDTLSLLISEITHYSSPQQKLNKILPKFQEIAKNDPYSPFYRAIYALGLKPFNLIIIKYAELNEYSLIWPNETDDKEIRQAKIDRLLDEANQYYLPSTFIRKLMDSVDLPEIIQQALLKNAIKYNDMDMMNALYGNTRSEDILNKIDKFLGGKFKYETLNKALESVDMVDEWPTGRALSYGENAKVYTNAGIIHISRGMNGKYSEPTVEEVDDQPSIDDSAPLRELIKKGTEWGMITYDELENVLPDNLSDDQIEDILEMIKDMNISIIR